VLQLANDSAANGSSTFVDQSSYAHAVTVTSETYSNTTPPTGLTTWAASTGGSLLSMAHAAELQLTGDFTIEMTLQSSNIATGNYILVIKDAALAGNYIQLFAGNLYVAGTAGIVIGMSATGMTVNTTANIAVTKSGSTWRAFVNGTQIGTATSATGFGDGSSPLKVGYPSSSLSLVGLQGSIRITNGTARYTANYTIPTLPLPTV
jgi:hypothetical protein